MTLGFYFRCPASLSSFHFRNAGGTVMPLVLSTSPRVPQLEAPAGAGRAPSPSALKTKPDPKGAGTEGGERPRGSRSSREEPAGRCRFPDLPPGGAPPGPGSPGPAAAARRFPPASGPALGRAAKRAWLAGWLREERVCRRGDTWIRRGLLFSLLLLRLGSGKWCYVGLLQIWPCVPIVYLGLQLKQLGLLESIRM